MRQFPEGIPDAQLRIDQMASVAQQQAANIRALAQPSMKPTAPSKPTALSLSFIHYNDKAKGIL